MNSSEGNLSTTETPMASPLRHSNVRVEGDDDLLLLRLLMGAQPTLLIVAAAEAKMFDSLGEQQMSADQLALHTNLDTRATRLVLDGLVGLGIITKDGNLYRNTGTSLRHLRIDTEQSHAVRLWISGTRLWERLPEILRTGKLPDGDNSVDSWQRDGADNHAFVRTMYDIGWLRAQSVAESVDLTNVAHVVDLGGGPGHYTIAMLERSPELRATLVDLQLSLLVAKDSFKRRGLSARVELVANDLYDTQIAIPVASETADLVLISHVVHMEGSENNASLMEEAARLLKVGGRIIIHDMFLEEDRAHPQASSLFAVHMLAMTRRGEVYPASVIIGWLSDAGLQPRVLSTSPFLVEGVKYESVKESS